MRLASVERERGRAAAVVTGGRAVLLAELDPSLPRDLTAIVRAWPAHRERLVALSGAAAAATGAPLEDVRLGLPFRPRRVLGVGTNYAEHAGEMRAARPAAPSAFLKLPDGVRGPDAPLALGPRDVCVDYEGEIAVVVGAPLRDADEADALAGIAGLLLANDLTARDVATPQITLAKGQAGFCPIGPWLVTADELDLADIAFTVAVGGEVRQSATTATMIHGFAEILASFSRAVPLEPGDVVLTGTPGGSEVARQPPRFLRPGDRVVVSSPQLGELTTTVIAG